MAKENVSLDFRQKKTNPDETWSYILQEIKYNYFKHFVVFVSESNYAFCGRKKSTFIRNQEASGFLSNLGIRTPLSNIPLISDILF